MNRRGEIQARAMQQERLLRSVESLGSGVVRKYVSAFQRRAIAAVRSGGKVKLSSEDTSKIVDELTEVMMIGFVRRYRQERNEIGIELSLSFSRKVAKLAKGFDLDLDGIRKSFSLVTKKRAVESVGSIQGKINDTLKIITARQQPTKVAVREMRKRLGEMGISAGNPSVIETLVRTHSQIAFAAAQYQIDQDDPHDVIWGYTLSVVGDDRMSDICSQPGVDGFTAEKNDPLWDIWTPPLHWNCRTQKISITAPAKVTKLPRGASVGDGFDFHPGKLLAA